MANLRSILTPKALNVDTDILIKNALLATLTTAYVLCIFVLISAVTALPVEDPQQLFVPPPWLQPLADQHAIFDIIISIVFGPGWGNSFVAILIILITTPRVARWLRVGINDLVYGQHDDAFALISQINPHIDGMNLPHTILPTIAATIAQTLKLPYVELEAKSDDEPLITTFGTLPPDTDHDAQIECIPLLYHDTKIGELRVAARRKDEPLSNSDLAVLRDLARQVGIALYAAQLTDDLQRARIRLVTAREEERRRIRRDLHDGLGPTLANFAMQLEQAREQLPPDAVASATILATLTTQAQGTITDVRRLVYDLRPPDLDEFGLISALREYMHRRQTKSTALRLSEPSTLPALPAAVEVATYRIVQEALNNALKHAQASEITIALEVESAVALQYSQQQALRVEIADNGIGIAADHAIGIGLHSMRERAEELGGSCTVTGDTGNTSGTRVVAYLPLDYQEA